VAARCLGVKRPTTTILSSRRSPARKLLAAFLLVPLALLAFGGSAGASAGSDLEGVWSFNGGAVAIQALPDGTLQGTVVTPTTFATCPHPVGQVMWSDLQLQPDGSYHGLHQWYHGANCEVDPQFGLTAWRVLQNSSGANYLLVCFSNPGSTSQPTIAPDGTPMGATYGCSESAPVAPLPVLVGTQGAGNSDGLTFGGSVILPDPKACVSDHSLKIELRDPKYDPLEKVVVKVGRKTFLIVRTARAIRRGITLSGLPSGAFKVSVLAVTVLKQQLSGSDTYHSCTKRAVKIKLHRLKHHHHS
jgi:hypothetical protein